MRTRDFHKQSLLSIFVSYFRPHMKLFVLDMVCALMISLIDLSFPYVSRICMYELIPQSRFRAFAAVVAALLAAYLLRSVFQYIVTYWGHTFGVRVEADIRQDLFTHLQTLPFSFYDKNRTGHLMSRITAELFDITELAHHGPEDLFISCVTVVGAIAIMFTIQWRLALVMLLLLPLFLLVTVTNRKRMMDASVVVKQNIAGINADIESSISGMRTAKAFSNESTEHAKFLSANERFKNAKQARYRAMAGFMSSLEFFMCIMPVTVISVGGWLIMRERMDYVDLITFSLYVTSFVSPIRKLANFAEMFSNGFAGLHRFIELMATEPSIQDAPDAVPLQPGPGAHQGGQHGKGGAGSAWDGQAGANGQVDQDHKDLGKHRVHPACQLFQTLGPGHSHHSGNGQPHGTDGQAQKGRPEMDACLGSQVRRKDQVASPEKHGKQREADEQQLSAR